MKYETLFTLELLHDYYADRRCGDFLLEPTTATQKLLANARCVLKPFSNGLRVLMPVDFIALPADAVFGFQLRLQNPNFALFTDLSEVAGAAALLYRNNGAASQLQPGRRTATFTEPFTVKKPAKTDAFTLGGRPLRGSALSAFVVTGPGLVSQPVSFDEDGKVLRVNSAKAKAGDSFTVSYPIQPQLPPHIFADVEISLAAGGSQFEILFQAKKARWQYYVVTQANNLPAIEDKDKAITFTAQTPDASDPLASQLAGQYPGLQTFRLLSDDLVACQQAARKSIQLQINGEKVPGALPNPALENFTGDRLYQIVKYFTQ